MVGNLGMESCDSKRWRHSRIGFQIMEERCYFGDLNTQENDHIWVLRKARENIAAFSDEDWTCLGREELTKDTFKYKFKNEKFQVRLDIKGSDWLGTHYIVSSNKACRLYTNCTMLDPQVEEYRENLLKNFEGGKWKTLDYPKTSDFLYLVIKTYKSKKGLTQVMKAETVRLEANDSIVKLFLISQGNELSIQAPLNEENNLVKYRLQGPVVN